MPADAVLLAAAVGPCSCCCAPQRWLAAAHLHDSASTEHGAPRAGAHNRSRPPLPGVFDEPRTRTDTTGHQVRPISAWAAGSEYYQTDLACNV